METNHYIARPLILHPDYQSAIEQHVLLAFTGIKRYAAHFAKEQIQNIEQGKSLEHLAEIKSIAEEALELFCKTANLEDIGKLLDRSWKIKKRLAKGVSNTAIDDLYAAAKKAGAFGGKLMGAGGGGFLMFMVPPNKHESLKQALPHIKVWVPLKIEMMGSEVIFHNET